MRQSTTDYRRIFAAFGVLFLVLSTTACATKPIDHPVVEKTIEVKVPVPTACVDEAKVPTEPAKVGGDLTGNARHDLDVVSASALDLRVWGHKLAALIEPCTKP